MCVKEYKLKNYHETNSREIGTKKSAHLPETLVLSAICLTE